MNQFFIIKTGWEMFDLSRAYGLGILVQSLADSDVYLRDRNYWFEIMSLSSIKKEKINISNLRRFLAPDLKWGDVIGTVKGPSRSKLREEINSFFGKEEKIKNILDSYSKLKISQLPKEKKITLYGTMELRAIKGVREPVRMRTKYSEGSPYKINKSDWMLSFLGHLNITIRKRKRNELLIIMPVPSAKGTRIGDLCEIRCDIDKMVERTHTAGKIPTVAWIGINLINRRLQLMGEEWEFPVEFSSLLYGSMTRVAGQMKPSTAGIFLLEYLNCIARSSKARDILNLWNVIFRKTNKDGYEDLALYLSEFLAFPTFTNFKKYISMHLKFYLNKEDKPPLYEKEFIEEVIKNVKEIS